MSEPLPIVRDGEEIKPPCLLAGVPHSTYHADPWGPSISRSIAHQLISRSPLHAYAAHPRLGGTARADDTEALDNGSLLHALLLGSGPEVVIVEATDWKKAESRDERDDAREHGALPVLRPVYEKTLAVADALAERIYALDIDLQNCARELTALWIEADCLCRCRLDLFQIALRKIFDLKIQEAAKPSLFARTMITYGLDIQDACYRSAVAHCLPEMAGRVDMEFLVAERRPPYAVVRLAPDGSMRDLGERKWNRALRVWRRCLDSGIWPGYGVHPIPVEAPAWATDENFNAELAMTPEPDWITAS